MKNIIKRSSDVLLFLVIFLLLFFNFKSRITKNNILNYALSNIEYTNYKNSSLLSINKVSLISNYRYNDINYKYDVNNKEVIKQIEKLPNVYIFNTHYEEGYNDTNVIEISKILTEKLNKNKINAIFEDTNYKEYVITNNLLGINNYIMIRSIIEEKIKSQKMDLVIDLHRDSISKKDSIVEINGKKYAKVLFVVDNYYKDYLTKYELANKFNNYLNKNYKGITRGVYVKNGKGFNQDLSQNMILLEVGGYQNNKEELINTLDVISEMIKEYVYE